MQVAPEKASIKPTVVKSMLDLADRFLYGGYEAIDAQIRKLTSDKAQQQKMADAYTKVLTTLLQAVYFDVLKDEGVK